MSEVNVACPLGCGVAIVVTFDARIESARPARRNRAGWDATVQVNLHPEWRDQYRTHLDRFHSGNHPLETPA